MRRVREVTTHKAEIGRGRPRSGIAYPYYNLDQSINVARAVHDKGGGACTRDQLAHFLNYSTTKSGAYLTRIAAAKLFGLIEIRKDQIAITDRAHAILAPVLPENEQAARVDAFLSIPLFEAIYSQFKGHKLPKAVGLKNLFKTKFNIVPDRVTPALNVMMDSAAQAGFFDVSGDSSKLIKPVPDNTEQSEPPDTTELTDLRPKPTTGGNGGNGPPPGIHTAIIGLLRDLPPPGTTWPIASKSRFMNAFRATIDFVYPEKDEEKQS